MRQRSLLLTLSAALLLSACASDATFLQANGAAPDARQLEADASDCRSMGPVLAGFFGGAALGAAQGALIGASSGGADVGAIIGAGAGGVIGLVVGAATSAAGDGFDRCMREKGYVEAAAPEPAPVVSVETAVAPALRPDIADPAR